ncbi:LPD38 domain-containing protein [Vibrio owensii]|uniref:LPD38 domain-containing protein n=1 Tax=Vibrio owensii TaxID=696485 RepID=UPI003AAA5FDD
MAKYSKEQYDQFIQDNLEVAELAQQAGIELSQLPEGALKFDALEPSWGQTFSAGVSIAGQNIKKQGLGLARSFIEEAAEPDKNLEFMGRQYTQQELGSTFGDVVREWVGKESLDETAANLKQADAEATQQIQDSRPYLPDDYSAKSLAVDAVGGLLPSLGTGLVVGAATRNPMLAGAAAGASEYGGYYGDSRDQKNLTPEEARSRARDLTLMSGATSALPMAGAIGKLGGGLMARVGGTALSEGAQESAMTLGETGYDAAVYDEALPQDLLAQTGRGFLVGALGGATMGSMGLGIRPESEVNPDPNPNVESQPETEMNTEAVDLNTPTYEREGVNLVDGSQPVNVTEQPVTVDQPQPIVNETIVNEQPTDVDPVQALLTEPEVNDAEPVEQTPIDDAPEVDSQPESTQSDVPDVDGTYSTALQTFSEIGHKKNKSKQNDLIQAANRILGTPKNPPKKGGKKALLKRITDTAKTLQSLEGETAESLKARFPDNKSLKAFRKQHGVKTRATNKDTMIQSILDWRDRPRANVAGRLDKKATHKKLLAEQKENKPISLDDINSLNSGFATVYQTGDVLLAQAKGEQFVPSFDKQGEDYQQASEMMERLDDGDSGILEGLTDEQVTHYAQRYVDISNPDIEYLEAIDVMENLGYPKDIARAVGKYSEFEIRDGVFEQLEARGIERPEESWKKKQRERQQQKQSDTDSTKPTEDQKLSDTDKPKAEKPQKYEAKDKTFYTDNNTLLDEVAAKYDNQEALEQAAFEAGKSNPNKFSPKVLQETGFNHAVDIDSAGFDGDKVLAKVEEGQKAGGAKGLVGSTPHKYSAMGTSLDEVAAKYKDQEALEKAAFEAGKANPDKNSMTAFGETGFYSLRDVEIAGFDPRKVSDAVKKGQEAAAKNNDKPNAEQRTETQTTEGVETPLTPPSKMSIARIGEIATANDRLGRIKQLIEKGYSRDDAIKLNNKLEVQRKRELEHKRGQDAIQRKPEPTLEPLAEQDKSPALDDVIIQLSGKSSPAYLAARKLAHNIKNRMVEGVSFNDAYNHYRKLNSSGISTFDRTYKSLTGRTPTQALLDPRKEKNLDQIKTVGDAIFNIKSGRDMAHWLSKHATSPVNRRIAERIAPLISADLKIKSIGYRKGNKPPAGMGNKQGWYLYDRFESGKVDERILLWNEGEKRASTEEVVTHELIHAATSLAIANAKKADPKSEIAKVVKELDAIRKEAFEHYVKRKAKRQLTATEKSKEGKFAISKGLNNENSESAIDEFVAWGLTNPELQDILKGIKLKPKNSAWSEFVHAIGKLLGLKPTDNTALGRLLETTDKLLTLSEAEQVAESRSLGADARNANGDFTQERVNELRTKIDPKSDRVPMYKDMVNKAKALQQQGFGNVTSNMLTMLRTGIADKYEPLKKLDEQLFGDNVLHDITSRAWVLAKTANSAQGALQAMLSFGRIRYNANQKLIETVHDNNDGGLMAVLEQLSEKHELADFFTWIAANRANEINEQSKAAKAEIRSIKEEKKLLKQMRHEADSKRTRNQIEKAITDADSKIKELKKVADVQERFLTEEDIEVGLTLNQLVRSDGTSREALFDKVFKAFNQYRGDILKIAEQNGIITSENREMWTDQFYVPFYRVLGDSDQVGMYPSAGLSRQDVIKKLKGSEKDLGDLMENALLNFHYLLNASLKNRAAMQALENGELAGIARQVREHKIKDKDKATYVMIDGKKQWYEVDDPVFLSALMSMGNTKLPKGLQEIAHVGGGAKVLLTKYTTGAPTFIVANFVRDMFLSPAMAKVGWKKGGTFHGARLWGVGEMNKVQADMLAAGGAFEFGFNRDEVKGDVDKSIQAKITQPQDAMRIFGKPLYYGKKAVRGYGQVQGIAENANRAAIYDANLDKGKLYAAFEAMDLMDFGAGGSWAAIRLLNSLVPFLNATIQGVDKTARQMGTVFKTVRGKASLETAAQAKRFALYAGSLATASVALALQNADDEEYQELPEYAKNTNWFVRIGGEKGEYILIPKPYSIGFMINTAERVTDSFTGAIKATDTLDYVKQTLFDTFTFNPTPQIAKPIMELYMNKNMFTGRAIETSSDRRYSKAERADYRTSEVAKMLGNDYLSPKQIDHLIKGYFSTIGDIVLNGTNIAVDAVTENERPTKHWYEGSVIPARVFYKDLSSPSFTKSQQRFYDIYTEYSQAKADYKRAVEMGDKVKAKEILTEGRVNIALLPMMDKYKRKLTDVNNRIDAVRNTKSLSADEKRSYIDAYNRLKAETYSAVIDQVDRVLERVKNNK